MKAMKKYVIDFLKRGMLFGGFGPIIAGIVFFILEYTVDDFSLGGDEVLLAIVSTYVLAFVQAGASIFNQIEEWPMTKSLLCHMGTIYVAYVLCYVINFWIPFDALVILIFTAVFAVTYLVIWFAVYSAIRATEKRLNQQIDGESAKK